MDSTNYTINSRKNKHLNFEERLTIQLRLNDGYSSYRIAKELNRPINTILNEIRRGSVDQIKLNKNVKIYYADAGQAIYSKNRMHSRPSYKFLQSASFINYVVSKFLDDKWSLDSCVGHATLHKLFKPSEMVCTKTLYSYVSLGLMPFKRIDLPLALRRNTKGTRVRKHKRNLGTSIDERPSEIDSRREFGHWEIDTVIGKKTKDDQSILTLVERQTRNAIFLQISDKSSFSVESGLSHLRDLFGSRFNQVFKTITADNGLEFSELHKLESEAGTKIYFAHPYASHERGTNERHNGLMRRFIPKGIAIKDFNCDMIAHVENWCNTLPRKILGYKTPEELFDIQLDLIYAL